MIRKVLALVLSVIICCSLSAAGNVTYAIEGACSGVVSALISQASEPRIALQGVTFSSESSAVGNVSFVRSDVATYRPSLRFFADPQRSAFLDSIWTGLADFLSDDDPYFFEDIAEGDVILDGGIRFIPEDGRLLVELSLLVTGAAVGEGVVIEGDFAVTISDGTAAITSDGILIDGELYTLSDLSFPIPELGGTNG